MNRVILIGRLTRDPEYSATEDWTPVCTFTLAVPRAYKDAEGKRPAGRGGGGDGGRRGAGLVHRLLQEDQVPVP